MVIPALRYTTGIVLLLGALLTILNRFWGVFTIPDKTVLHWTLFGAMWVAVLIMLAYAHGVERGPLLVWPETKRSLKFHALSLLALFAATVVLGIVNKQLGGAPDAEAAANEATYWAERPWLFLFMGLTAGGTEEILFRGYVQPRLNLLLKNPWLAIVCSSVLFAVAHYTNSSPTKMLFLVLFGVVFGFHYYRYRSLVALVIAHVLVDVAAF
jgi:membrane protease YdiL (CAAX protease family)